MIDGVDCINVYSRGKLPLGRELSNFAYTPFKWEGIHFASVEAWWYFRQCLDYSLCPLYGYNAKREGSQLVKGKEREAPSQEELLQIYWLKVEATKGLEERLSGSILPFDHFYTYGNKIIIPRHRWTGLLWNDVVRTIKGN